MCRVQNMNNAPKAPLPPPDRDSGRASALKSTERHMFKRCRCTRGKNHQMSGDPESNKISLQFTVHWKVFGMDLRFLERGAPYSLSLFPGADGLSASVKIVGRRFLIER